MSSLRRNAGTRAINIWPGFVDALAALLMVVIFVLLVFMVAQFYMSNLLSGQEQQVARLRADVQELEARLMLEADVNDEMSARFNQLQADYGRLDAERTALEDALSASRRDHTRLSAGLAELEAALAARESDLTLMEGDLSEASRRIAADSATIEQQRFELTALGDEIESLRLLRDTLQLQVDQLSAAAGAAEAEAARLGSERDDLRALVDPLQAERDALARSLAAEQEDDLQGEIARDVALALARRLEMERQDLDAALSLAAGRIEALQADLAAARDAAATTALQLRIAGQTAEQEIARLQADLATGQELADRQAARIADREAQVLALQSDVDRLTTALTASEDAVDARDQEIAGLEARLNQALLRQVEELSRYRSDFFGRLRAVVAGREGVAVVGDRFVFQSEVLFPTGSAQLQPAGRERLAEFAQTLLDLAQEVPDDIDWVLRVDGHTDRRPINSPEFPSNWELSTARAVRVVRFLEDEGVPADRLAAAGFAAFQPIDDGDSDAALARNRRIELRLDQR